MLLEYRALLSILPPLLILVGLAYFVATDKHIRKIHKKAMLITIVLIATMFVQDVLSYYLVKVVSAPMLRQLNCTYGYIVYPIQIIMVYYFVGGKRRYWLAWSLVAVNAAVFLVSLFTPIAFKIQENNVFWRGPLGFTSHIVCVLLLLGLLYLSIREHGSRRDYAAIPIACLLLLVGAILLDSMKSESDIQYISFTSAASVISCMLFYLWMHRQLINEYEKDLLTQQRIKIMVSQIQPHFLYNTIATFKALCKTDPDKAATVAEKFGQYLRENLDSLNDETLISVEKELAHTRVYAEIEMVRFENIRVEYDVQDTDFMLPALTIQPIVENAIRHGVRIREAGVVRVCVHRADGVHEIVISDNGIGFDASAAGDGDGTHIGLANVRERIEKQCGGTLTIASEPDKGTTVTIRIPETEMKK